MPRLPRYVVPGQPQHLIQRGNNRNAIFASPEDFAFFKEKLADACARFECDLHAYVLMTNHVHLLMTPRSGEGLSKVMQSVGRYYVQYFNRKYNRTGTLWEGRYRATLIDSEAYLITCMRYIELNPVRAGMVSHPMDYPYSSYSANGQGKIDKLVTPHSLYNNLGKTRALQQLNYRNMFKSYLSEETVNDIREATNKAWALGDSKFRDRITQITDRRAFPLARGGKSSNRV